MTDHNEASVEEILSSIKKVIARENRENARTSRRRESDSMAEGAVISALSEAEVDVLDLGAMELTHSEEDAPPGAKAEAAPLEEALIGNKTRESMREKFAALELLSEPEAPPQIAKSGETSLEGLVRDMLRPMLAEWLDKNLPDMVEKMVQKEIAQIVRNKN